MNNIITATVIKSSGIGTKIGYPTINLKVESGNIPEEGVYPAECFIKNNLYQAASNIGNNPTFKNKKFSIELHLFDFNENALGEKVKVKFFNKIRNEKKFNSKKELVLQIKKDIQSIKKYFEHIKN